MKKAIIFGANGQDGFYMMQLLQQYNIEVLSFSRSNADVIGSVGSYALVDSTIGKCRPDYVFHFAAVSSTNHDFIFQNHEAIATGTLNILESVKKHAPDCRVFLSGSALQFENKGLPIKETNPFAANTVYSVARIHATYAGRYFRDTFGIKVYTGYFFNHDSPKRNDSHINQKIISAVHEIKSGKRRTLEIGNAEVKKEFNFAGDIVKSIWTLVNQNEVYEATLGSGIAYPISDWLSYTFASKGLDWREYVISTNGYKSDYNILVSNSSTIRNLGWTPKLEFYQLADLMLAASE